MRKTLCTLALLFVASAAVGHAQPGDEEPVDSPKWFKLGVRWDGVATCYWEGHECVVT